MTTTPDDHGPAAMRRFMREHPIGPGDAERDAWGGREPSASYQAWLAEGQAAPNRVEHDAAAWADRHLLTDAERGSERMRGLAENAYLDGYDAGRQDTRAGVEPWQDRPAPSVPPMTS